MGTSGGSLRTLSRLMVSWWRATGLAKYAGAVNRFIASTVAHPTLQFSDARVFFLKRAAERRQVGILEAHTGVAKVLDSVSAPVCPPLRSPYVPRSVLRPYPVPHAPSDLLHPTRPPLHGAGGRPQ